MTMKLICLLLVSVIAIGCGTTPPEEVRQTNQQVIFGKFKADKLEPLSMSDVCSPYQGREYGGGDWVGIERAVMCYYVRPNSTVAPMEVLIKLDMEAIPGQSLDSCILASSYGGNPTHDEMTRYYLWERYSDFTAVFYPPNARGGPWALSELPEGWVSIRHSGSSSWHSTNQYSDKTLHQETILFVSEFIDYSLRGICIDDETEPEAAIDIPIEESAPKIAGVTSIQKYDETIRLDPQNAAAYHDRGYACYKLGEYDRAIEDYTEAIRLNPQEATTHFPRGVSCYKLEQYEQAIADYTEVLRLDSAHVLGYFFRSCAYGDPGKFDEADRDQKRAKNSDTTS